MGTEGLGNMPDSALHFYGIWKGILSELLGWSEEETHQWATKFEEYLQDSHDIFFHRPPQYWLTWVLIPDSLKQRLKKLEVVDLERRLVEEFGGDKVYDMPLDTDWKPYREKVQGLLAEYGAELPRLRP
jgi:hypothetical protein